MGTSNVYVVGVTRFSLLLPDAKDWNLSTQAESSADYATKLYDEGRLASRLEIFSTASLPQLAALAKEFNYRHVIQHSTSLPEPYQAALRSLAKEFSFLKIVCSDVASVHSSSILNSFIEMVPLKERQGARLGWFRLDDDDIVSDQYLGRIVPYIQSEPAGRVVSLGLGYSMIYHDGALWDLRSDYRPKNSVGQLYICGFDASGESLLEPPRRNHALIDQWAPTILDSRQPSFITVVHPFQDGRAHMSTDDALAAVQNDQARKPVVSLQTLSSEFSRVLRSGLIHDMPDEIVPKDDVHQEILLSTRPVEIAVQAAGDMSLDADLRSEVKQAEGRVIFGLRFSPGTRPNATGRWVVVDDSMLAVGFVVTDHRLSVRANLLSVAPTCEIVSISVWVSRSFKGDVWLNSLALNSQSSPLEPTLSHEVDDS